MHSATWIIGSAIFVIREKARDKAVPILATFDRQLYWPFQPAPQETKTELRSQGLALVKAPREPDSYGSWEQ